MMGLVDFFLSVLPFFVAEAVDVIDVAVKALSVAATVAAIGVALSLLFHPCGGVRCSIHHGEEGKGHDDDLDLVNGSLCDVRCWRQGDAMVEVVAVLPSALGR